MISRRRFIHLGTALGVSTAGASVLAACGGGATGGASGGGGGEYGGGAGGGGEAARQSSGKKTDGGTQKQTSGGQVIAQTSEVAPGSAINFKDSGSPAVLIHLESGDFVAYSAVCTHQQCQVAYRNGQLACPCHGSVFDPANNGQIVSPPANRPLPQIPIEVRGGEVFKA
jgi:cytochrome b6-f complex iron-sulfur subunit